VKILFKRSKEKHIYYDDDFGIIHMIKEKELTE